MSFPRLADGTIAKGMADQLWLWYSLAQSPRVHKSNHLIGELGLGLEYFVFISCMLHLVCEAQSFMVCAYCITPAQPVLSLPVARGPDDMSNLAQKDYK